MAARYAVDAAPAANPAATRAYCIELDRAGERMRIAFIGAGNMASAIICGLLAKGTRQADICAVDPSAEARDRLASACGYAH